MKRKGWLLGAGCAVAVMASTALGNVQVIGSFAGGVAEPGWGRWNAPNPGFNNGLPQPNVSVSNDTSTDGDGWSAKINHAGNMQTLAYSAGVAGTIAAFQAHNFLVFDLVYAGIPTDPQGGGFNELWEVVLNSQYGGFQPIGGRACDFNAVCAPINGGTNADGTLTYTFIESLAATYPYYAVRLLGGLLVLGGMFIMAYNVIKTVAGGAARRDVPVMAPAHA